MSHELGTGLKQRPSGHFEYIGGRTVVGDHGDLYDDDINQQLRTALGPDRTWAEDGSCMPHHNNGADLSGLFYPESGEGAASEVAPLICAACPARAGCFAYGLEIRAEAGVWGGIDFGALPRAKRHKMMGLVAA